MADVENKNGMGDAAGEKLACEVKISDSGPWKKKISVVIPREAIDKESNGQYRELLKTAEVPGFRKGRAPRRLVEKRFGENVSDQVKLKLIAQSLQQIEEDHKFEVLTEPEFDVEAIKLPEAGDLTFEYEIEIRPEFELPTLEGIAVEKQIVAITPERVTEAVEQLQKRFGKVEHVTEGKAGENDLVVADVTAKIDGIEEPVHTPGVPVRVGASVLMGVKVEGLEKSLKGIVIGKTVTCGGQFSDGYQKEEYRGKKVEFTLEVKGIDRMVPAELNAEFLASLGVADEAGLRSAIEENLEGQAERESQDQMKQQVVKYLSEKVNFDLPAGVAGRHAARLLSRRYYELMQQGVPQQQIHEHLDQLRTSTADQSAKQLKQSFIMDRVADKLEISVSEGEVNGWIAQIAGQYRRRPERVREEMQREGMLENLRDQIRHEKALEKILEMASVTDAPAAAPKAEKKAKAEEKEEKPKAEKKAKAEEKPEVKEEKPKAASKKKKADEADADDEESDVKKPTARKDVKRKGPKGE